MAFEHRAFCFDLKVFESELGPVLYRALSDDDVKQLRDFIERHREGMTDPYEGEPLPEEWEEMIETKDVHAYGDFALTKYYSAKDDIGIGNEWAAVSERLRGSGLDRTLLGLPFGPPANPFDPGRMGSYFQSVEMVVENIVRLEQESPSPDIERVTNLLKVAREAGAGLYVTF